MIVKNEDLTKIRKKFQLLADNAVRQIKSSGAIMENGKNLVPIEERARRIYKPSRSAFFGNETSNKNSGTLNNLKEQKTLETLEMFDKITGDASNSSVMEQKKAQARGEEAVGPDGEKLVRGSEQDLQSASASVPGDINGNPNNNSSTVSSAPGVGLSALGLGYEPNYYGIRLDQMEFDEQELFDNFKPIFDFNNPGISYDPFDADGPAGPNATGDDQGDYEMYGISPMEKPHNNGINPNLYNTNERLRNSMHLDQTADLLLP